MSDKKKKILFIGTGGTISCKDENGCLTPSFLVGDIIEYCPVIKNLCDVESVQLVNIDSTNMRQTHWLMIENEIQKNYDKYDGFVIAHGTDTMAYSAAALSYLIQNSKKPIVFTGSQKPIDAIDTDAIKNIEDAFLVACDDNMCDVLIVFCGMVIFGTRARKNYTKSYNAFESINFPIVANVEDHKIIYNIQNNIKDDLKFYNKINSNVGLLKFVPGMRNDIMSYLIDKHDGLVIESFGVGGLPDYSDFYNQLKEAIVKGKIVVMTTQVLNEGSDLSIYRVGAFIKRSLNILEAYDMTTESALAKLMWILSQTTDYKMVKELFYKTINNDILCKENSKGFND